MRISQDVRDRFAQDGMRQMSETFVELGSTVYVDAESARPAPSA